MRTCLSSLFRTVNTLKTNHNFLIKSISSTYYLLSLRKIVLFMSQLSAQVSLPLPQVICLMVTATESFSHQPPPTPLAQHAPLSCCCLSSITPTLSHLLMLATSCPPLLLPLVHCGYPISITVAASCLQLLSLTLLLSTAATTRVLTHPLPSNPHLELCHCHLSSNNVALSLCC